VSALTAVVLVADEDPLKGGSFCAQADSPHPSVATRTAARIQTILDLDMSILASGLNAFRTMSHIVGREEQVFSSIA
jgi:hypothetical protein